MKRMICSALLAALLLLTAACGGAGTSHGTTISNGSSVSRIMEDAVNGEALDEAPSEDSSSGADDVAAPSEGGNVDLDLTQMNGNMVYAEVSHMMEDPAAYAGTTIRMEGLFSTYELEDRIYYGCVIPDATACCMQGVEFVWAGDHVYPDDYPDEWDGIRVTGVYDVYEENGEIYGHVTEAELVRDSSIEEALYG